MRYFVPRAGVPQAFVLAALLLLCCMPLTPRAQSDERAAVRAVVEKYFDAYRKKDLEGLLSLWSSKSPDFGPARAELQKLFAGGGETAARVLEYRRIDVGTEEASVEVVTAGPAAPAPAAAQDASRATTRRTLLLRREDGAWKIWQEGASEERLAAELIAAPGGAERTALLRGSGDLLTGELLKTLVGRGKGLAAQGKYERALAAYGAALEVASRLDDKAAVVSTRRMMGIAYYFMGDYAQALDAFGKSLELAEETNDRLGVRDAANGLGIVYNSQGDYAKALEYDERSLRLSEESGDKVAVARDLNNVGSIHYFQGNQTLALDYFQRSLKLKEEAGNKSGIAYTLNNIAGIYAAQGDYGQALDYLRRSLAIKEELKDGAGTADTLHNIGYIHFLKGEYAEALEYDERSLKLAVEVASTDLLGHIWINVSEIRLKLGDYARALEAAGRAAEIALKADLRQVYWQARADAGRAHLGLGQPDLARRDLLDSIATIEKMREQVVGDEQDQQRFFEDKLAPYYAMVDLSVARGESGAALGYAEQAKGRVLLDVLGGRRVNVDKAMTRAEIERDLSLRSEITKLNNELKRRRQQDAPDERLLAELSARMERARLDYESFRTTLYASHPELKVKRGQMQPFSLAAAAELLPDGRKAMLEYVLTGDKAYLFVVTRTPAPGRPPVSLSVHLLKLSGKELAAAAEEFRERVAGRDLTIKEPARRLYDVLIKPAEGQLRGVKELCIVPDGALWQVPFQALYTAEGGYLIERYAVSYAPSLNVLREMMRRGEAIREARRSPGFVVAGLPDSAPARARLLAVGNPSFSADAAGKTRPMRSGGTLTPLPETEAEVEALGQLYGADRSKILTGRAAREGAVKADAGKYLVLHFATHALLNDSNPMYSRIVLSGEGGDAREDGLLEAWEIMKLDLSAELVVLSACQTARGRFAAGEGIIGMSWALFVAGSPSALVSQWKVDSARSADLMIDFHRNLLGEHRRAGPGLNKSQALRRASLRMLGGRYNHPAYWAGFILIGDDR